MSYNGVPAVFCFAVGGAESIIPEEGLVIYIISLNRKFVRDFIQCPSGFSIFR